MIPSRPLRLGSICDRLGDDHGITEEAWEKARQRARKRFVQEIHEIADAIRGSKEDESTQAADP